MPTEIIQWRFFVILINTDENDGKSFSIILQNFPAKHSRTQIEFYIDNYAARTVKFASFCEICAIVFFATNGY